MCISLWVIPAETRVRATGGSKAQVPQTTVNVESNNVSKAITNQPPTPKHTNRLAGEKSPYLLQHQHNPVAWYPWGEAAFAKAREENQPIFLSIGYSTCHWCHVMERESFEDESVAAFLNAHFVAIKVDREERPDVDKIYMTFVQAMTGQGGWPLNVFLTPDLQPFYGGTYWPPAEVHGRAGFVTVLHQVQQAWAEKREQIAASALDMQKRLAQVMARKPAPSELPEESVLRQAGLQLKQNYDPANGGWGHAPKFPTPSHPAFLLLYGTKYDDPEAIKMVLHTCDRMAHGGVYDQLGGGFHRYSVDEKWLVPHFEKMLYDNAQLLALYLDAYLVSGQAQYAEVARGIAGYVLRDMTHPEGGFYSAEDADSEGKEGKFYCWTRAELSQLLTVEEFNVAVKFFGVTQEGNFIDHSDPSPLPHQNVLSVAVPALPPADRPVLASARAKMIAARRHRVRPHLDDKVLASWNGLMLGALARASVVLGETAYREAAERNLAFLKAVLWDAASTTLYHRWRDGERDSVQLLDAYASVLSGTLELYQATLKPEYLEFSVTLGESLLKNFYDAEAGGFWQSRSDDLILRVKEDYDGAEPSGNSVAILALLKLSALTGRQTFRDAAEKSLRLFGDRMQQIPQAVPYLLAALDYALKEPRRIVIAGAVNGPEGRELLRAAHAVFQPHKVIMGTTGPVEEFVRTLAAPEGKPTVYLCTGNACQPPTQDAKQVMALLR